MFPNPKEQQAKLALLGMSGAIGECDDSRLVFTPLNADPV